MVDNVTPDPNATPTPPAAPSPAPVAVTPPATPDPAATPPTSTPAPAAPAATPPAAPVPKSLLDRIDELVRKGHDKDRELAELRTKANGGTPPVTTTGNLSEADVETRAGRIAAQRAFDSECVKIYETGKKDFPDFTSSVDMLNRLAGSAIIPIIESAMEVGDAHKVIYELGKNPEEAMRIAGLPIARQAAAVAKFATTVNRTPAVSSAPVPITPVVGAGSTAPVAVDLYDDNTAINDWMKERIRQKAAKSRQSA